MSRGIVGSRGDRATIASPLHKDVFDLETGHCFTKETLALPTWRVRVADGIVEVAPRPVLVAASHGTDDESARVAIAALIAAVQLSRPELVVNEAFVDVQQPDVPTVIASTGEVAPVTVVPLLLSTGFHVKVDLAEAAADAVQHVEVSLALGPDVRLAHVLSRRLDELGLTADDQVVLAAAGSSDASAVDDCHTTARLLSELLGRSVTTSFISAAAPRVEDAVATARAEHPNSRVVISTYLLAPGYFASLLGHVGADAVSLPLLRPGEAPPVELVDIVSELYDSVLARH